MSDSFVELQVPVFKNLQTPGYACCVPKPFLSLVAGNTIQEVEESVNECVTDFVEMLKEEGHTIHAPPTAPSLESLNKQDGFQRLLTVRLPGIWCCRQCCRLLCLHSLPCDEAQQSGAFYKQASRYIVMQ